MKAGSTRPTMAVKIEVEIPTSTASDRPASLPMRPYRLQAVPLETTMMMLVADSRMVRSCGFSGPSGKIGGHHIGNHHGDTRAEPHQRS